MRRIALAAFLTCVATIGGVLAHDDDGHDSDAVGPQPPAFQVITLGSDTPEWYSEHLTAGGGYASDGVYLLRGDGWDYYWAWDRGGFAYVEVEGDFTFSARMRGSMYLYEEAAKGNAEKFGLVVREDLTTTSKMAALMWDRYWYDRLGHETGISWYWRHEKGSLDDEKSVRPGHGLVDNTVPDCATTDDLHLRLTRAGDSIRFATRYGSDGEWRSVAPVSRDGAAVQPKLSGGRLYVGFGLSTGGGAISKRNPMQVAFDSISLVEEGSGDEMTGQRQDTYETERLTIRRFALEDHGDLLALARDKQSSGGDRYDHAWPTTEDGAVGMAEALAGMEGFYATCLRSDGRIIGLIGFNGIEEGGLLDLGHMFHTEFRGRGYDTEAIRKMVDVAFEDSDVQTITTRNTDEWAGQVTPLVALGFTETSRGPASFMKDSQGRPIEFIGCRMDMTRDDWIRRRNGSPTD